MPKFKKVSAGAYHTEDGRFKLRKGADRLTGEIGWLVVEKTDDGWENGETYSSLKEAKAAVEAYYEEPAPTTGDKIAAAFEATSEDDEPAERKVADPETAGEQLAKARPNCKCGCGVAVMSPYSIYLRGHDAKHVSKLIVEVTKNRIKPGAAMKLLPSGPLQEKLRSALAKRAG